MQTIKTLHNVLYADLEGKMELVVHNEIAIVHCNAEIGHRLLEHQRMLASKTLFSERSRLLIIVQASCIDELLYRDALLTVSFGTSLCLHIQLLEI